VPRVPDQRFGIRHRLAQLADLSQWPEAAGAVPAAGTGTAATRLAAVVTAAAERHGSHGYANPVKLVHAVTAPNAVMRILPVLPEMMWPASLAAAWTATAAVTAAYAPAEPRPLPPRPELTIAELADRTATVGDPHAIKYADAVADVLAARRDPVLLAAALRSVAACVTQHQHTGEPLPEHGHRHQSNVLSNLAPRSRLAVSDTVVTVAVACAGAG
jgi:hypothetical protein